MTSFAALHLFLSLKPEYQADCVVIREEHEQVMWLSAAALVRFAVQLNALADAFKKNSTFLKGLSSEDKN